MSMKSKSASPQLFWVWNIVYAWSLFFCSSKYSVKESFLEFPKKIELSEQKSISQQYHIVKRQNQQVVYNGGGNRISLFAGKKMKYRLFDEENREAGTRKNQQHYHNLERTF